MRRHQKWPRGPFRARACHFLLLHTRFARRLMLGSPPPDPGLFAIHVAPPPPPPLVIDAKQTYHVIEKIDMPDTYPALANKTNTEPAAASIHAFSKAEKCAFVRHINAALFNDGDLAGRIPIDPSTDAIFEAVRDGILLWYPMCIHNFSRLR
jgi:hypothetical protein